MPLPIILAAMALSTGAFALYKNFPEADLALTLPHNEDETLSEETKHEINFEVSLIVASAYADGVLQEEENFLTEKIKKYKEKYIKNN